MRAKLKPGEAMRARLSAAAAALLAVAPNAAHAYLDPGLAYVALQGALGVVAALGATLVLYRDKVRAWLRRTPREKASAGPSRCEDRENADQEQ